MYEDDYFTLWPGAGGRFVGDRGGERVFDFVRVGVAFHFDRALVYRPIAKTRATFDEPVEASNSLDALSEGRRQIVHGTRKQAGNSDLFFVEKNQSRSLIGARLVERFPK
jgi:hypothetical protein